MINKSHARMVLLAFGFLDALLLVRVIRQLAWPTHAFEGVLPLWLALLEVARPLLIVSLACSALGLMLGQRWAMVLSYVQFPFRLIFVLLTFGFISKLAALPGLSTGYSALVVIAMMLEAARLFITITLHRGGSLPSPGCQDEY